MNAKHRIELIRDFREGDLRFVTLLAHDPAARVSARSRRYDAAPAPTPWRVDARVYPDGYVSVFAIRRVGNLRHTGVGTARGRAIVADVRAALGEVAAT